MISGYDGIPVVQKRCAPEIALLYQKNYNICLAVSFFLTCWISYSVVPVFMYSGEHSERSNYRPLSLLPFLGKAAEVVITADEVKHLTTHKRHSDKQNGFSFASSTANVITAITEFIYQVLDNNSVPWIEISRMRSTSFCRLAFDASSRATVSQDEY